MTRPLNQEIVFGKHKGKHISEVPTTYLKWLVKNKLIQWEAARDELNKRARNNNVKSM